MLKLVGKPPLHNLEKIVRDLPGGWHYKWTSRRPMNKAATILLAEDNSDDVVLMKLAFKKAGLSNPVHVVSDGAEAIEYLKGAVEAKSTGCAIPLLISLDLKMPICNGFEVLRWIREQPALKNVPVLILSASETPKDVNRANNLGANAYLVKPANFQGLVNIMGIFQRILTQVENGTSEPPPRTRKPAARPAAPN